MERNSEPSNMTENKKKNEVFKATQKHNVGEVSIDKTTGKSPKIGKVYGVDWSKLSWAYQNL